MLCEDQLTMNAMLGTSERVRFDGGRDRGSRMAQPFMFTGEGLTVRRNQIASGRALVGVFLCSGFDITADSTLVITTEEQGQDTLVVEDRRVSGYHCAIALDTLSMPFVLVGLACPT